MSVHPLPLSTPHPHPWWRRLKLQLHWEKFWKSTTVNIFCNYVPFGNIVIVSVLTSPGFKYCWYSFHSAAAAAICRFPHYSMIKRNISCLFEVQLFSYFDWKTSTSLLPEIFYEPYPVHFKVNSSDLILAFIIIVLFTIIAFYLLLFI